MFPYLQPEDLELQNLNGALINYSNALHVAYGLSEIAKECPDTDLGILRSAVNQLADSVELPSSYFVPEEIALESLSELPAKIWNAIAKVITWIKTKLINFYNRVFHNNADKLQKLDSVLDVFEGKVKQSEATIAAFKLTPGHKIEPADLERIKESKLFVFTDSSGHVLSEQMYKGDMTLLIPAGRRNTVGDIMRRFVLNGKYPDLPSSIKSTLSEIQTLANNFTPDGYLSLVRELIGINNDNDLIRFFRNNQLLDTAQADNIKQSKLQQMGGLYTAKPILGDCFPTFWISKRVAGLGLTDCVFSFERGRLKMVSDIKPPKKFPIINYDNLIAIRSGISDIETMRINLSNTVQSFSKEISEVIGNDGQTLSDTEKRIETNLATDRNTKDITQSIAALRQIAKNREKVLNFHVAATQYLQRLENALNAFIILMVGNES